MYLWNFIVKRLHFNWEPFCIKTGYKNFTKSAWHRHTNFKAFPLCFLSIWLLMSFLPNSPPPPTPLFQKNQSICHWLSISGIMKSVANSSCKFSKSVLLSVAPNKERRYLCLWHHSDQAINKRHLMIQEYVVEFVWWSANFVISSLSIIILSPKEAYFLLKKDHPWH